ncbi:MAG: histone-lysine N-methyltransferase [Spirochaetales bacterium]|nr:histone-lysine N-methyltransferase [Spirochaetales bacterium]
MHSPFSQLRTKPRFPLQDPEDPELYRDQFPYTSVPRILFDGYDVIPHKAPEIWITDTTFRDGQQSRPPYTPDQISKIFDFLHRLGGSQGVIRQTEFFLYSTRDREALELCQAKNYRFPEITGWIRSDADDLKLVKDLGLAETGILTSVSDYHIFLKLKKTRAKILDQYLGIVKEALSHGIVPRCHFEDVTRADLYGFVLPFAERLLDLAKEAQSPVKVRLCDTMGFGVTYPGATVPRSIPRLVHAFSQELGYPSEWLEWHGHNDFHKVHVNAVTAWLYGCSSLNASLLGFGERTGNPPLEGALMEYLALKGDSMGIDTTVITEIGDYFRDEIQAPIPANYPFVGAEFNTTRAGIHADGILKNPEIYNIFDTDALLKRPLRIQVTDKSGVAGIAQWINDNIPEILEGHKEPVNKRHGGIKHIYTWVMEEYQNGRTTSISPEEMLAQTKRFLPSLFVSEFEKVTEEAKKKAQALAKSISESPDIRSLRSDRMEDFLHEVVTREGSIQLLAITNLEGRRITQVHVQRGEKGLFRNLMNKDFRKHEWFVRVLESQVSYDSDLYFSKYTGRLILTSARPLFDEQGKMFGVMDIDFIFDELVKLITPIPDEILR